MATYTLALINNHEDGKIFFGTYNIPYQVITRGANAGKLRVKQPRVRGKVILQPHGKEFFTWYSKHLFTLHGKHFFT